MANTIPLKDFLETYGESMAEKVTRELKVIHDPSAQREDGFSSVLAELKKKPFPAQEEIIKAGYKSLMCGNRAVYTVCEMGTGKTLMAIAVCYLLHRLKKLNRVLVICPPHLVLKWIQEIRESVSGAKVTNLNGKDVLRRLEHIRKRPPSRGLAFFVIGRERAKTGFLWRPAVVKKGPGLFCPRCGQELLDMDGCPLGVFETNARGRVKKKYLCNNSVMKWQFNPNEGIHRRIMVPCNEPLWQPDVTRKNYRKYIPAKYIKKRMKGCFDLLVADEVHMYKNQSGQGYAFGALAASCRYILCLTGTLAGGYASDVYHLLFRTHPRLMLEDKSPWGNPRRFIERYGVLEKITTVKQEDGLTTKAKRSTVVKEKPGISPLLLGKMFIPNSVFMRLSDCMEHLQPYDEEVIELSMDPQMAERYMVFENTLKNALRKALAMGDNSLLGGYLHALLSYPERIHKGVEVIHPRTKEIVACGPPLEGVMPKEHELLSIIGREVKQGRRVMVYFENSLSTDISPRIVSMLEERSIRVKVLRSGDTQGRAKIIDKWVKKGIDVLMTNPRKVEVGMDLLDFPSIVFYQIPMSTYTLRQASRRSWRIPQRKPVKVYFLAYRGTMQTRLMQLMADKLISSLTLEGELSDKGLAALSETSDSMTRELAKMLFEKAESGDNQSLKDIWAAYRKKEVQVEKGMKRDINDPENEPEILLNEATEKPSKDIKKASTEVEKIGERIVKVHFVEYVGKRKKKVTHIEVREAELETMVAKKDCHVHTQFALF